MVNVGVIVIEWMSVFADSLRCVLRPLRFDVFIPLVSKLLSANLAHPHHSTILAMVNIGIFVVKRMAVLTHRLPSVVSGNGSPPQGVFLQGNCFEMGWIHATAVATKMIDG